MSLIPLPYRILIIAFCAILAGLYIFQQGKISAAKEYLPQITQLRAQIDAADTAARATIKTQQETTHEISTENADNIARIRAYYDRMLHTRSAPGTRATPVSSGGIDAAGGEQTVGGCDLEFERACVLDANKIGEWQHWAERNHIPIEE